MTEEERNIKRFDVSIQIRNLEIDLFWKRSLFFWGFIAAAFGGYAALRNSQSDLAIVVACFSGSPRSWLKRIETTFETPRSSIVTP